MLGKHCLMPSPQCGLILGAPGVLCGTIGNTVKKYLCGLRVLRGEMR